MRASFADACRFVAHPKIIREITTASAVDQKLTNDDTITRRIFESLGDQINVQRMNPLRCKLRDRSFFFPSRLHSSSARSFVRASVVLTISPTMRVPSTLTQTRMFGS
jgi:hypothetical protein